MGAISGGRGLANGVRDSLDDEEISRIRLMPEQGRPDEIVV